MPLDLEFLKVIFTTLGIIAVTCLIVALVYVIAILKRFKRITERVETLSDARMWITMFTSFAKRKRKK
jgi:hypothetical protein